MSENCQDRKYEVFIPICGHLKIDLKAQDKQDAIEKARKIAIEVEKNSLDTAIPNLYTWRLDRKIKPIVFERGELIR